MRCIKLFLPLLLLHFIATASHAQETGQRDSLVRLIEARSASLMDTNGVAYRKIIGPARFLHNNTYLLCDTAIWEVETNIIHAVGHVQIVQENTFLTSDKIDYLVNNDLAQFRGHLVELYDKDGNVLRTNYLDYNTKDSVAVYYNGGAMRGTEGNLIESRNGRYVSQEKTFYFYNDVEMFTDSVFIKSEDLRYNTETDRVFFGKKTVAWQQENILTTESGYLDRPSNTFHFDKDGHILTAEQELWADTLVYNRDNGIARLYGNIQVLDTVQSALAFADYAEYLPEKNRITMNDLPSVAIYTFENDVRDTIFFSADTIVYHTERFCDIDSAEVVLAKERKKLADMDPVREIENENAAYLERMKHKSNMVGVSAEEAAAVAAMQASGEEQMPAGALRHLKGKADLPGPLPVRNDTLKQMPPSDSVQAMLPDSSLISAKDTLQAPPDTSSVAFIDAWHNVKLFRADFQGVCDSLVYTGIDSIARLYKEPVLWNDTVNQITSDSIQISFRNNAIYKANMISNAFIAVQEDSAHYNQVRGTEMIAFFRDNDIYRFDAIGGASMIFFLREKDSLITTMNRKEGRIISSTIKERQIQKIKYIEELKNDAYPTYNLTEEEKYLRGFVWFPERRPVSREEVCNRSIKASRRKQTDAIRLPLYPVSEIYFKEEKEAISDYRNSLFGE